MMLRRTLAIAALTLVAALLVGVAGAIMLLREPAHAVRALAEYLLVSGALALAAGSVGVLLGMRFLPRLSLKVGLGYVVGSVAAMLTILYTPLLMFKEQADLHLLILLLTSFLIISLGLAAIIGLSAAGHVRALADAAKELEAGRFETRVEVSSGDELAELASAFNRMSAELGNAFARERAMEQGRRDLVAAISHDLRTPLASMRAMLEAIQDGVVQDEETIARYHQRMRDEINRLARLIDDLFELSRLDAGQLQLDRSTLDLGELLSETVESLAPKAQQHGVRLELDMAERGGTVCADPLQVQRVVLNLLENAIRHTKPGGAIHVAAHPNGGNVAVEVSDTGEGIAPEDAPHIFDRFYRGEKSRARHTGGAGLGLAISKAIVEAHQGTIWAESAQQGTRFVFTLPTAQPVYDSRN